MSFCRRRTTPRLRKEQRPRVRFRGGYWAGAAVENVSSESMFLFPCWPSQQIYGPSPTTTG
jgi:hypothetical protein